MCVTVVRGRKKHEFVLSSRTRSRSVTCIYVSFISDTRGRGTKIPNKVVLSLDQKVKCRGTVSLQRAIGVLGDHSGGALMWRDIKDHCISSPYSSNR